MWIPKGYHPIKLISPMQQQTKMAKLLVKRKRGKGKPAQKRKTGMRKLAQKKTGTRKPTKKKKNRDKKYNNQEGAKGYIFMMVYLFICCFTSLSTARVILQQVVYRWRKPVHTAL